jgi:putative RNA 2'-phosphotransferase
MSGRLVTVSKFVSKYLRHEPQTLGLVLEPGGWVLVDDLLEGAAEIGFLISRTELVEVVAESDKRRFSFDERGEKIRANQGHSAAVDLQLPDARPPDVLYHGTPEKFVAVILVEGLRKMRRHDVHLSPDVATAVRVGSRRGKPVILVVDSDRMAADGYTFRVSANGVWLTDNVPPQYLRKDS